MRALIDAIQRTSIAVVGDFFLDEYISCDVMGVSPEMPVLRLIAGNSTKAPGAAGNLAANFQALGARVSCVGLIGQDADSTTIESELMRMGIDTRGLVQDPQLETRNITRFVSGRRGQEHHHLRVDRGTASTPSSNARDALFDRLRQVASDVQAVFIADYDESSERPLLESDDLQTAIRICRNAGVMVFGTSRGRMAALAGADVLLCNRIEATQLGIRDPHSFDSEANSACERFSVSTLCVTRGTAGASALSNGKLFQFAARRSNEVDPCGAGDSFAAAFALSLVAGGGVDEAGSLAALAGGLAVERSGTSPVSRSDLLVGLAPSARPQAKFIPIGELIDRFPEMRAGRRVVFTNGCFDVFHSGHVQFLRQAKELGDLLVVALNSDRSTEANKGPGRPVIPAQERIEIVSGLESVDVVTLFDELTPIGIISALRPDVLVKGGDYTPEDVVGKSLVEEHGGQVLVIPESGSYATKDFIRAVSSASPGVREE